MRLSAIENVFGAASSPARGACMLVCALLMVVPLHSRQVPTDPDLAAHEWGTFTVIAGTDGQPVEWLPVQTLETPELPSFIEHFRSANYKAVLRGTLRLETPVIYFYTAHETNLSVHVSFSKGLITEWYPQATRLRPLSSLPTLVSTQPMKTAASLGIR